MGYAYFDSPLTLLEEGQSTKMMEQTIYQPIVAPGYFLPHRWIQNQKSIYDVLSATHWTLIVSDAADHVSVKTWVEKFKKHHLTLKILNTNILYPYKYILLRPDWHIASVCNELNDDYFKYCLTKFFNY